jgi:acylglycerol lipase
MNIIEDNFYINGKDNIRIHIKKLVPENSQRILIVFHGVCEHAGRYNNFIDYFVKRQNTIYIADHRGHGKSEGTRGYIEDFNLYSEDALEVIRFVNKSESKTKFIIAHSLGALVTTYTYLKNKAEFKNIAGFVFSSPAYKLIDFPDFIESAVLSITKRIKNKFFTLPISPSLFINDLEEVKKYKNDPLVIKKVTPSMYRETLKGIHFCEENIEGLTKPILLLLGAKDNIINHETILNQYLHMKSMDKEKKIYLNSNHELFNDLYRNQIFSDINDWTENRTKQISLLSRLNPFKK